MCNYLKKCNEQIMLKPVSKSMETNCQFNGTAAGYLVRMAPINYKCNTNNCYHHCMVILNILATEDFHFHQINKFNSILLYNAHKLGEKIICWNRVINRTR